MRCRHYDLATTTRIIRTATIRFASGKCTHNDRGDASHTGLNGDRLIRAVAGTRSTFHAGIAIYDVSFAILNGQHSVRADSDAHTATATFRVVQCQCHNASKVSKPRHVRVLAEQLMKSPV